MVFAEGTLDEIGSFISNVGFPIAVVIYILWKFGPGHKKFIETATETNKQMPVIQARQAKTSEDTLDLIKELKQQNANHRDDCGKALYYGAVAIDGLAAGDPKAVNEATTKAKQAIKQRE